MGFKPDSEASSDVFDGVVLSFTSALKRRTVRMIIVPLAYDILVLETQLGLLGSFTVDCVTLEH